MIKLIASDLDGTLLKEGTMDINPEIYEIIRKLKAKGIVFAAVSGREYDSIERVFAPVKDDIYFIAGNGGIISYQGEIIEKMAIPADILKEVVEYVRSQKGASFMTAGSAQAYVERADQEFVKKLREGYKLHVNEVDDVLNAPETMTKVAMYNEEVDAAAGAEEARKIAIVKSAISTLSFSELEAITHIFDELDGNEGILVASRIADRVGITRSVIVNALRKFESAGVIESRSSGMKGTYIKVVNDVVFDELAELKRKNAK